MYIHAIAPVLIMFLCTLSLGALGGTARGTNLSFRKNQLPGCVVCVMTGRDCTGRVSVNIHTQQVTKRLL